MAGVMEPGFQEGQQLQQQEMSYGTMHNGCWYPPSSSEAPQQTGNAPLKPQPQPQMPVNTMGVPPGQGFFVPFPAPGNQRVVPVMPLPQGGIPQGGNEQMLPMQFLLMMQKMQGMQQAVPPNMQPQQGMPNIQMQGVQTVNPMMMSGNLDFHAGMQGMMPNQGMANPGIPGKQQMMGGMMPMPEQPSMEPLQQMPVPQMSVPQMPVPNMVMVGEKLNYVPGTFTEDQIVHQTVPEPVNGASALANQVRGQPGGIDILPEILRKLSMSPSQSEMSSQSTNVYTSEECSHASSDTDKPESPDTGNHENHSFHGDEQPLETAEEADNQAPKKAWAAVAEGRDDQQPRAYDRRREQQVRGNQQGSEAERGNSRQQYNRAGQGRRPYNPNYNNTRDARGPANRNTKPYQQQNRTSPRNQQQSQAEDDEWQTVDRSRSKNRQSARGYHSRA